MLKQISEDKSQFEKELDSIKKQLCIDWSYYF